MRKSVNVIETKAGSEQETSTKPGADTPPTNYTNLQVVLAKESKQIKPRREETFANPTPNCSTKYDYVHSSVGTRDTFGYLIEQVFFFCGGTLGYVS